MNERKFLDGQTIFSVGDPADVVYRIRSGDVRGAWPDREGKAPEVRFGPGEIFGEAGVLTGEARSFTAVAVGAVEVDLLGRDELLARLADDPTRLGLVVAGLFGPRPPPDSAADPAADQAVDRVPDIRLVPDGKRVRAIVGADEVVVGQLPFSVGRAVSGEGMDSYDDVSLVLDDRRPFNLSRRHFTIDREEGTLVVRDNASYHGTMVNGLLLNAQRQTYTALLVAGENEIVAGPPDSPFRFRIVVG